MGRQSDKAEGSKRDSLPIFYTLITLYRAGVCLITDGVLVLGLAALFELIVFQNTDEVPVGNEVHQPVRGPPVADPDVDPVVPVLPDEVDDRDMGTGVIENADGSIEIEMGEDERGSLTALEFE